MQLTATQAQKFSLWSVLFMTSYYDDDKQEYIRLSVLDRIGIIIFVATGWAEEEN